ncbi:MAG: ABC transporter ATP-binding protein [Bacteroidales bacterium]|jgi:putative ABC transport system ATP-binding protein|nr:ABC transporter ATP-binding protein [Bacteroidales bacterium]
MEPIIELKDINKKFGSRVIFDNLNLTISKGEMVAIMGQSGSGKTTLLNIMGLLEKADSGEVVIDNKKINRIHSRDVLLMLRYKLGYVFQNFALVDNEMVWKALDVALSYVKADKREKEEKKGYALKTVNMLDKATNKIYELSGGEQQRVAIARLMLKPCEIVLADEPTGSMDDETGNNIMKMFRDLNERGKTVIIVTHNPSVAKICDRTLVLADNKISQ